MTDTWRSTKKQGIKYRSHAWTDFLTWQTVQALLLQYSFGQSHSQMFYYLFSNTYLATDGTYCPLKKLKYSLVTETQGNDNHHWEVQDILYNHLQKSWLVKTEAVVLLLKYKPLWSPKLESTPSSIKPGRQLTVNNIQPSQSLSSRSYTAINKMTGNTGKVT